MSLSALFSMALAAILAENYVLVRFLGVNSFLEGSKKLSGAAAMGLTVTVIMVLTSAFTWLVNAYVLIPLRLESLQTIAFVLIIAALAQGAELGLKRAAPALYTIFGVYLPLVITNCVVLGAAILSARRGYGFAETVAYGLFAGLGFTLAIVLFAGVRERLEFSKVPKAFEGFPIALVTAGLLAMVFMGF